MIWLSWRQFRAQAYTVATLLLAFVVALTLTWDQVTDLARSAGFTGCQPGACDQSAAGAFRYAVSSDMVIGPLYGVGKSLMLALPVLLGVFWGAPLIARELETRTYRIILSQSVSRRRWLLVKLAFGGVATALLVGLVSLVLTRWSTLIDQAGPGRISPMTFTARGIVPIAYATLAFILGALVGQALRRTLTAMTVTLLVVAGLQVAAPFAVLHLLGQPVTSVTALEVNDSHRIFMDPSTKRAKIAVSYGIPGAVILSRTAVTSTGAEFEGAVDTTTCDPSSRPLSSGCEAWLKKQNLSQKVTYVPGSSFWALQWQTFGVLFALTLALAWFSLWWVERRLA
jgi:ABC-type transport system involved in multi-copper enzyme maturation permease subunit